MGIYLKDGNAVFGLDPLRLEETRKACHALTHLSIGK
jgi:hypothetical protein